MHILLISSAIESLPCTRLFERLKGITLHGANGCESLFHGNTKLDLVFFDAALGMEDITQQIQLYQQKQQSIKWIVINATDIQQSLLYLQLGASGILTQPSEKTLQDCLQSIANGQLYLEADFIQILALRQIKKTLLPFKQLTAREYDIFCMLAEDYSIQMIAELLSITTKTAFNCQAQLRKKLEIRTQQDILKLAKKHGLIN
jgi:DNA-binding NarL/FixJ family response regulator